MTTALLLVPNQGDSKDLFLGVAQDLKKNFCKKSVIFGVTWGGDSSIAPNASIIDGVSAGFSKNFWESVAAADTFISLSHCGRLDGPMLGPEGEQPWPSTGGTALSEPALLFWRRIGWGIGDGGRVLLAGCDTAQVYAPLVSQVMSPKVFGFAEHIGAGVISEMRIYIANYFLKNRVGKNVVKC